MNGNNSSQGSRVADSSQYFEMVSDNRPKYTPEEQKARALAGSLETRKKIIAQYLVSQGTDPDTIDIDAMMELGTREPIPKKKNNKYFKSVDGTIIKIDQDNFVCYKFDSTQNAWIQEQSIISDLENGLIQGEFIEFNDTYPTIDGPNQNKKNNL